MPVLLPSCSRSASATKRFARRKNTVIVAPLATQNAMQREMVPVPFVEIEMINGDASEQALKDFAERFAIGQLVIKDGGNGSRLYQEGTWYSKAAFQVKVVDTVGAGDGFDAGYIHSVLHGYAPEEALEFANGVGALVTTVSGDNEGLPYLQEVLSLIRKEKVVER